MRIDIEHYFDILFASRDNGHYEEAREYERNIVHAYNGLFEQLEAVRGELETTRADLYQCKREREILSRNLSAFTGNA